MKLNSFYKALDEVLPGGELRNLDTRVVPNRSLYLTRISMDGLDEMHEYSKDKRLYKHFEFEPFKTVDQTKQYLQKLLDRIGVEVNGRKHMYWFIRLVKNNKIIGSIGLVGIEPNRDTAEWGYAISPEYWGHGHILEAQLLITTYFFEVLKMNRLWGITEIDNKPTISSVLSAGFQKEGILRDYYKRINGERKDGFIYSLLAKDYFAAKVNSPKNEKHGVLALDTLRHMCSNLWGISGSEIDNDSTIDNVSKWDSLNHISLIITIEDSTGFKFNPAEIARATSVKSILEIVNNSSGKTVKPC